MKETIDAVALTDTRELLTLAVTGIGSMYDPEKGLFCHRLRKTPEGLLREGISHRYTMMTLLGLLRAQSMGLQAPVDAGAIVDRLLGDTAWINNLGDLGLLLWVCAVTSKELLRKFHDNFDLSGSFRRFPDARLGLTMELSWFLTGLVFAAKSEPVAGLESLAHQTFRLVQANAGPHGLFGHVAKWHSVAGVVRGSVGSFADQVYPTFAMAHFSEVFNSREARDSALRCAHAVCRRQSSMGQWWWHYDSVSGRVVEHYPVYSVHQHGMAPMALLALEETCGAQFDKHVQKGLTWINGANELHQDMVDTDAAVAWRCIQSPKANLYVAGVRALIGKEPSWGPLHVVYECRPYELGWLLYAFASSRNRTGQSN
jgi:hypothetical protein